MVKNLKRIYFSLLVPSILGFAIASWAKAYDFIEIGSANFIEIAGPLIFILGIVLAIAFPIFYRALFAHKSRDLINLSEKKLLRFERTLIRCRNDHTLFGPGSILFGTSPVLYRQCHPDRAVCDVLFLPLQNADWV